MAPRRTTGRVDPASVASSVVNPAARVTKARPAAVVKHKDGSLNLKLPARSVLMGIVRKNADSPLLRLPAEIRRMIWDYAIGGHALYVSGRFLGRPKASALFYMASPIGFGTHGLPAIPKGFIKPTFSLPRVCRQLYAETSMLPYSLNVFTFSWYDVFDVWARSSTLAQKRAVLGLQPPPGLTDKILNGTRTALTKKFPMLKTIDLTASYGYLFNRDSCWIQYEDSLQRLSESLRAVERGSLTITWVKREQTVVEGFRWVSRPK